MDDTALYSPRNKFTLYSLQSKHPYLFAMLIFPLIPFTLMGLQVAIARLILTTDMGFGSFQNSTKIISLLLYFLILWRLGWLGSVGLFSPGSRQSWLIMLTATMVELCLLISFIKGHFDFRFLTHMADPPVYLLVGLFEEIAFRGLILYNFLNFLGRSRKGICKAVLISALIFGSGHLTTLFSGNSVPGALYQFGACVFSGVFWAGLVMYAESLWPAVLSHFLVDAIGIGNLASYTDYTAVNQVVFWIEVPLFILGIYLLFKASSRDQTKFRSMKIN